MAKVKRVISSAAKPYEPSNDLLLDCSKTAFKNQRLLQESEKLAQENEAKRKRLEMLKQKKMDLLSEIKFLRRRYRLLTSIQAEEGKQTESAQPLKSSMAATRKDKSDKKPSAASPGLKQKRKSSSGNDGMDRSKKQKVFKWKGIASRVSCAPPDMTQCEVSATGKHEYDEKVAPVFDLNEKWEEKELQDEGRTEVEDEAAIYLRRGTGEEQVNNLKPSACRSTETGANRMRKRRISWQDPVALRV